MYICFAVNLNFVLSRQGTKLKNTFLPFFSVYFNLITQPVNWSSVHFVFVYSTAHSCRSLERVQRVVVTVVAIFTSS